MKTITSILAALILTILTFTSTETTSAGPRTGIYIGYSNPVTISAHPRHHKVWVEGRYVRKHHRLVWVPGHWVRVR